MCEEFASNFDSKSTNCCIVTIHHLTSFFSREFLIKNNTTVIPSSSCLPDLATCDYSAFLIEDTDILTFELIEAGSRALLNTLKEHHLHNAFGDGGRQALGLMHK
jgi:hypothetical protein